MSFENQLVKWYINNKRELPWRENIDPCIVDYPEKATTEVDENMIDQPPNDAVKNWTTLLC